MAENTIKILSSVQPRERFVLKEDRSLERIAEDAPKPEGHIAVVNPHVAILYVEDGNFVRPVEELKKGQKPYEFPDQFTVYIQT
ncbi:hypothetical protein ISS05_02270 [Candidatus Woesearchaeota archaeon]|nr:hypothetical protein [Candidatus Woesearchaeota archaeon]